ncbi:response regulator transcription factor [Parafilimonas sp.]|uniref:response regulator transcription factor n=1 Tax=Parafilimonas sp. TaxID=1969739 RepID=UPI0039E3021A
MNLGRVLFIEDELTLAEIVRESLDAKGFDVTHVTALSAATLQYHKNLPDIIVADVMLPDGDGFDWVKQLRKSDTTTPVIFLTARSQTEDVVKGFELGGNDYLKKPFSIAELIARMKALLKKGQPFSTLSNSESIIWTLGQFIFYYPAGKLISSYRDVQLTSREADLLHLLLLNLNYTVSRNDVLLQLWGNTDYFSGRSLDVFISKLRKYLRADASVKIINIRGLGYKLITY